jgi:ABC-2 type transport system ATP-binding protein
VNAVVEVQDLVKRFGTVEAVAGVTFSVAEGELFGFLGPNGAGKSTTIKILCTLSDPTSGRAIVNGFDVTDDPDAVRRSIGIIFQDPSLDDRLTAMENLNIHGRVYHLSASERRERSEQLLKMVDLWDRRDDVVRTFSGGMKRRLEIARGLLHQPSVLFLDEPTVGLDPQTREHIWSYLDQLRASTGTTIFLTTHYMDEAERCDRIAIIDYGKIVAEGTPDELKGQVGGDVISLHTADNDRAAFELHDKFGIDATRVDGVLRFEVSDGEAFIPRLILALPVPIASVSVRRPSLDDVFLRITGREIREETVSGADQLRGRMRTRMRR